MGLTVDNHYLLLAKKAKFNEFYTTFKTVKNELDWYTEYFKGKSILCNCNDTTNSNFFKYFYENFKDLQLKKLVCVSYDYKGSNLAYKIIVDSHDSEPKFEKLEGNGDFRTEECTQLLKEADIVVTNPPFSLFKDFITQLFENNKKFLILCATASLKTKLIFPLIFNNVISIGYNYGTNKFAVPPEYKRKSSWIDKEGHNWQTVNICWLTNLPVDKSTFKDIELTKSYDASLYPKYDGQDVIEVSEYKNIPKDYYGIMGVPTSYLGYHNGKQFEIVGIANQGSDGVYDKFKPIIEGKQKYCRVLIKRQTDI